MWRWARGVGDWTSKWKVRKRKRERELYCAKEGENCLKIERENDKRKIILNCKREKKRETL